MLRYRKYNQGVKRCRGIKNKERSSGTQCLYAFKDMDKKIIRLTAILHLLQGK